MNKFLTTLFAGALALSLGTAAFAADAVKTAEPVKTEAVKAAEPAKTEATATKAVPAKTMKKHHRKHAKKTVKKAAEVAAPAEAAPAALTGK